MSWIDRLAQDILYDELVRDKKVRAQWIFCAVTVIVFMLSGGKIDKR